MARWMCGGARPLIREWSLTLALAQTQSTKASVRYPCSLTECLQRSVVFAREKYFEWLRDLHPSGSCEQPNRNHSDESSFNLATCEQLPEVQRPTPPPSNSKAALQTDIREVALWALWWRSVDSGGGARACGRERERGESVWPNSEYGPQITFERNHNNNQNLANVPLPGPPLQVDPLNLFSRRAPQSEHNVNRDNTHYLRALTRRGVKVTTGKCSCHSARMSRPVERRCPPLK